MDGNVSTQQPTRPSEGICRSDDVADHIGLIRYLVGKWVEHGKLNGYERNEIVNEAVVQAHELLTKKYNPDLATVSTFLGRFLFGRVEYSLLVGSGLRKREGGWKKPLELDPKRQDQEPDPAAVVEMQNYIDAAHPDIRPTLLRIIEGESIRKIALESLDTTDANKRSRAVSELRAMLRIEMNRLKRLK